MTQTALISSLTVSTYVYPGAEVFAARVANSGNQFLRLPTEILNKIFGNLSLLDLAHVSNTCIKFHNVVSNKGFHKYYWENYDLMKEFPTVKIIDETVWRRIFSPETLALHGLSFEDADPQDNQAIRTYLKNLDFSKIDGTGSCTGITLLTVPTGLTFNKLVALAGSPKVGERVALFRYIWNRITQVIGDTPVAKTYRVAISNNILKESRQKHYHEQQQMSAAMGGQMPEVLPVSTLCILTYMSAHTEPPTRLFNDSPYTFTSCVERIDGIPLALGGNSLAGLYINIIYDSQGFNRGLGGGVGFIRKF